MKFTYTVKEFSEKQLAGISVQTDMSKAMQDCPTLWQTFGQRLTSLAQQGITMPVPGGYGVSVMLDENRFTYWAAVECGAADALSKELQAFVLPGGAYVHCKINSLAEMGDAYHEMYMTWPQLQSQYEIDMTRPCFEFYDINWEVDGSLELYAPVKLRT